MSMMQLYRLCLSLIMLACLPLASAAEAGSVHAVTGTASVQHVNGTTAILTKGASVSPGDIVTTQQSSTVHIVFSDGSELAVRPSSSLQLEEYRFRKEAPKEDGMIMRLLKGGMRQISGLIGKRGNQDAYSLRTTTATIGIRGTDFVARLCEDDCSQENGLQGGKAVAPTYAAKIVVASGVVKAIPAGANESRARTLAMNSPIFAGDTLVSSANSYAVIVFRDDTRLTLQPNTRFLVEGYRYDAARPAEGNVVLKLLQGGLRTLTGFIGRAKPENFKVRTATATIGIRGTGFDTFCTGACIEGAPPGLPPPGGPGSTPGAPNTGLTVHTWQGTVRLSGQLGDLDVGVGQTGFIASPGAVLVHLPLPPDFMQNNPTPRPDTVPVDLKQLFGATDSGFSDPGLYLLVKDGAVDMKGDGNGKLLFKGEVGYLDSDGKTFKPLGFVPLFLDKDIFLKDPNFNPLNCKVQ